MKNSTFIKGLFASSLVFLCANTPVFAQDVVEEEPQDSVVETVQTVYQMVDHITSGNSYVIGILTNEGSWMAAVPPFGFGFYPAPGRVLCEKAFQLNDNMQIVPSPDVYLPTYTIEDDGTGTYIKCNDGTYLGINTPYDDSKDEGKDDGKGQSLEYTFLIDTQLLPDYYWDIAYDEASGGFIMKNKGTNTTVGVDYDMMTTEYDGKTEVTYQYRLAPYEVLPEELNVPIYFFELQQVSATGIESAEMEQNKAPKMVYSLSGVFMGNTTEGLNPGIYVVKQGKDVKKVLVK